MDFNINPQFLFYICTAAAAIFLAESVYLAVSGPLSRRRSVNRRLQAISTSKSGEEALKLLRAERGIFFEDLSVVGWLRKLLIQSGLHLTAVRFLLMIMMLTLAIGIGLHFIPNIPEWASLLAAVAFGIAVPIQIVRFIRSRRQKAFAAQLPDALDVVVRSLRSGHPVPVALGMVGREMADPIGTEFGLTIDEMTYGLDTPTALRNLADRVGVADLSLMVTAVTLQATAGGNLSEVLSNLAKVMRDRFQLRRKVRALSSEGRVSAYGLTVLPIMVVAAIYVQNPRYYTDSWDDPIFWPIIFGIVVWSIIGDIIMFKMINFKY